MTEVMAVRTRFFDDFFVEADRRGHPAGGHPGVRPRRAGLPAAVAGRHRGVRDRPAPGDRAKTATMAELGAEPTAERRAVAIDLRDDWPAALRDSGFDVTGPRRGVPRDCLMYLPPEAQDRLFDNITALSAPGSRIATEYHGGDFGAALGRAGQGHRRRMAGRRFRPRLHQSVLRGRTQPRRSTTSAQAVGRSTPATGWTYSPTTAPVPRRAVRCRCRTRWRSPPPR